MNILSRSIAVLLLVFVVTQIYSQNNVIAPDFKNSFKRLEQVFRQQKADFEFFRSEQNIGKNTFTNSKKQVFTNWKEKVQSLKRIQASIRKIDTIYLHDTLVIGATPGEELLIDSVWVQNGPIIVLSDGILRFKNASATILGDIYLLESGQILVDSSTITIPQQYFYQRIILLMGNSNFKIWNSTISFGGLVHSIATTQNSYFEMINVEKQDFSTIGMYNKSSIFIDNADVAGEFIIIDSVDLQIYNSGTVLLWHHFGEGAEAVIDFPEGENVGHYTMNNSSPDISGINYNIEIDSCTDVMWGLMPAGGSDVSISDSEIRSIGLWFEGSDSTQVSGLINNSFYADFTPNFNDRNLHLINCDVQTWSLYTYDSVVVEVKSSILGEIGVMGHSTVSATNYFLDGSGGYLFAEDTTFLISAFSSLTSSLRSNENSIVLFAYSTMMNGLVQALGNSVLLLLQSTISTTPELGNGAAIWTAKINGPDYAYENSKVSIDGTALIDLGIDSNYPDFASYSVYYQKNGDSAWILIDEPQYQEVQENTLVLWNTAGLSAGVYLIKLEMQDSLSLIVEVLNDILLIPEIVSIDNAALDSEYFKIYPNPVLNWFTISINDVQKGLLTLTVYDSFGNNIQELYNNFVPAGVFSQSFFAMNFPSGIYYVELRNNNKVIWKKVFFK